MGAGLARLRPTRDPSRRTRHRRPTSDTLRAVHRPPHTELHRSMGSVFGQAFRIATFGESHGGGVGVVVDGCPPRLAIDVAEIQARPRPPASRAERADDAAPGGGPGRDPLGRLRRHDPRHPDRAARPQPGRAPERLRGHARPLPAVARGLHDRGEVRDPQLAGRRPRERARDDRPRRGRGDRAEAPADGGGDRGPRLGEPGPGDRCEGRSRERAARGDRGERRALPRRGGGRADVRADRRGPAARGLGRRRRRVRRRGMSRRASASPSSTSSRPTSRRR